MTDAKDSLQRFARSLGYDLCGVARIIPPPHAEFVDRWLDSGHAAGLSYLARNRAKRLDPTLILAGARTVVSVAARYASPPPPPADWQAQLRGRVAAYALGPDYHKPMQQSLDRLARYLEELFPGERALSYVDTGPILEREWASLGGLGWFGRNTNLLNPRLGSWFLLGEVITTADLPPDEPHPDRCGSCRSCVALCPTGALGPAYELDARLCISYWTIEHRGAIPVDMRSRIGPWVFGCDVCQEVCPWNEKTATAPPPEATEILNPYLPDLLRLDETGFAARFRSTSLWRTRRAGLARNACVVLGNTGNPEAVGSLAGALETDVSTVVRGHAAWALGRIGGAAARRVLHRQWGQQESEDVRAEIALALDEPPSGQESAS